MTFLYNIKFASQELEFIKNTLMTKVENFQKVLSENQKIILQVSIKATNNVITFNIIDFSEITICQNHVISDVSRNASIS